MPSPPLFPGPEEPRLARTCRAAQVCLGDLLGSGGPLDAEDCSWIRDIVRQHCKVTQSRSAWQIVAHWASYQHRFVKVIAPGYRRLLGHSGARSAFEQHAGQ